jgi:hypothetical protein
MQNHFQCSASGLLLLIDSGEMVNGRGLVSFSQARETLRRSESRNIRIYALFHGNESGKNSFSSSLLIVSEYEYSLHIRCSERYSWAIDGGGSVESLNSRKYFYHLDVFDGLGSKESGSSS